MEVIQSNIDIIFRQAKAVYDDIYALTPTWNEKLATPMPSSSREVTYAWMDRLPTFRKWVGNRAVTNVISHSRTVVNEPFELTAQLYADDVADDQLGLFTQSIKFIAAQAKKWPDQQIADFIINKCGPSSNVVGYDGVSVFNTAHPINGGDVAGGLSGTQSNLYTSTALTYDNYAAVREDMQEWVGSDGQPLNILPNLLVVPPGLEAEARLILQADMIPNTAGTAPQTNVYKASAELLVIRELANKPNNWWLFDTTKMVLPFMWQLREAPNFQNLTSPTDLPVFMAKQFLFGGKARGAAAETLWFLGAAATSGGSY